MGNSRIDEWYPGSTVGPRYRVDVQWDEYSGGEGSGGRDRTRNVHGSDGCNGCTVTGEACMFPRLSQTYSRWLRSQWAGGEHESMASTQLICGARDSRELPVLAEPRSKVGQRLTGQGAYFRRLHNAHGCWRSRDANLFPHSGYPRSGTVERRIHDRPLRRSHADLANSIAV